MIKYAGTERARKEICKDKQCEKLKIMENVKNIQPEIYERQMRYMRYTCERHAGDIRDTDWIHMRGTLETDVSPMRDR